MSTGTDADLTELLSTAASSYNVPPHGPAEVVAALSGEPARRPVLRRRWVQLSSAAGLALVFLVGVAAVGGGYRDTTERRPGFVGAVGGSGTDTKAPADFPGNLDRSSPQLSSRESLRSASAAGGGTTGTVGASGEQAAPSRDGAEARVVKTGSVALIADDGRVPRVLAAVQRAAASEGGYVSASTDELGDSPSGQVTVRVPAARFEALLAKIRGLGAEVRSAQTSGKDVTAQYADVEAQLRTLRAARERFLDLLARARTIAEILAVQQRVDEVTGRIDRLEGSRRLLASQSDLSTLSVTVSERGDPAVERPRSGLAQAVRDAKNGFVDGVEAIVRHSGTALVWLLVLTGLVLGGRVAWRVARRAAL